MSNRNSKAGTKADSTTTDDDMQVSQTIAKPMLADGTVY